MASSKGRNRRHAHLKKRPASDGFKNTLSNKPCTTCGKQCYWSRSEARRAAQVIHPGTAMHVYACYEESSGKTWFHLSSIPADKLRELRENRGE